MRGRKFIKIGAVLLMLLALVLPVQPAGAVGSIDDQPVVASIEGTMPSGMVSSSIADDFVLGNGGVQPKLAIPTIADSRVVFFMGSITTKTPDETSFLSITNVSFPTNTSITTAGQNSGLALSASFHVSMGSVTIKFVNPRLDSNVVVVAKDNIRDIVTFAGHGDPIGVSEMLGRLTDTSGAAIADNTVRIGMGDYVQTTRAVNARFRGLNPTGHSDVPTFTITVTNTDGIPAVNSFQSSVPFTVSGADVSRNLSDQFGGVSQTDEVVYETNSFLVSGTTVLNHRTFDPALLTVVRSTPTSFSGQFTEVFAAISDDPLTGNSTAPAELNATSSCLTCSLPQFGIMAPITNVWSTGGLVAKISDLVILAS